MSWWDDGSNVLGDGPADELKAAWRRILSERGNTGIPKPTLSEALYAYASALRSTPLQSPLKQLELHCDGQPTQIFTGLDDAPKDLIILFAEALKVIVQDYELSLQRPPSPNETAKTFEFIVSADPDIYISEPLSPATWRNFCLKAIPVDNSATY
jgi:hypothetical protein